MRNLSIAAFTCAAFLQSAPVDKPVVWSAADIRWTDNPAMKGAQQATNHFRVKELPFIKFRTLVLRLCGHVCGGPRGVVDQSFERMSAPSSPPPLRTSVVSAGLQLSTA